MIRLFDNPTSCKPHPVDKKNGIHRKYEYPNGYGASVVRFKLPFRGENPLVSEYGSYTDNDSEWEVAVTYEGHLCYDTPITPDVVPNAKEKDVEKILREISKYPKRKWHKKIHFLFLEWYKEEIGRIWDWKFRAGRLYRKLTGTQEKWEK